VKKTSPTGLVPLLKWQDIYIGESLSIAEFLAESHPEKNLWPKDKQLRALARSAAAEMHSGFSALRNTYATNFVAKYEGNIPVGEEAKREVGRVLSVWSEARKASVKRLGELGEVDDGFLFGGFSIADAFFWPVLWVRQSSLLALLVSGGESADLNSDFALTTFHLIRLRPRH
jgi:glutathione S-transferase